MTRRGIHGVRCACYATLLLLALLASACGADPGQAQARSAQAQLDGELQHAQQLGIPHALLQPITSAEKKAAANAGGWGYSYQHAATSYASLYARLLQIEQQSRDLLLQAATRDLGLFSALLDARRQDGFVEADGYQQRLDATKQQLSVAQTLDDIAHVDHMAQAQTQALQAMVPTYDQMQTFKASLDALQKVGIGADWTSAAYTQDLADFRAATNPEAYTHLQRQIRGQITQLTADNVQAGPYMSAALLAKMQGDIDQLKTYGDQTASFQQNHDADALALRTARTPTAYVVLLTTITQQRDQLALPLARDKAQADMQALDALVKQTSAKNSLLDYEYADSSTGIGDVALWFQQAPQQNYENPTCGWDVVCRYGQVDAEAGQMLTNLQAMLVNLNDKTPASQPHQTDLQLMQDYGFMSGLVTVVSLREQVARAYQDGQLVYWSLVTTGRPELPTPPGVLYAVSKQPHIIFQPLGPIGPANGYPTPINYAVNFTSPYWHQFQGYYLHDAWWRLQFGPGSNLPHYDPAAFNTGSHGCINFPLANMGKYYDWVQVGTPVIVY
ncbi:MAG TPA: L,D-transpeptidase [Ktedonobacterales bacterium]